MSVLVQKKAPDFTAQAVMPDGSFQQISLQILGCSVDSHYTHLAWRNTPRSEGGIGDIRYPLLADLDKSIAEAYDVLLPDGIALRGLFLIDRDGIVRHQLVNDLPLGDDQARSQCQ